MSKKKSLDSPTCEHGWPVLHPDPCPQCEPEKFTAAVSERSEHVDDGLDLPEFLDRSKHPELNVPRTSDEQYRDKPTGVRRAERPSNLTEADLKAIAEIEAQQKTAAASKSKTSHTAAREKKRAEAEVKKKALQASREEFHKTFKWDFDK